MDNILKFEKDFPGAKVIRLEQNYRSTPHILAAASGVIANNSGRLGKSLWTDASEGEKVRVLGVWDGPEEARRVGEEIESCQRARQEPRRHRHPGPRAAPDPRVRRPLHHHRPAAQASWAGCASTSGSRSATPSPICASSRSRPTTSPSNAIVNTPKRGLGDKAVQKVHQLARAEGVPLTVAAARILDTDELTGAARRALGNLVGDMARWRGMASELPHPELARQILDESGYTALWQSRAIGRGRRPAGEPHRARPRDGGV